MMGFRMDMHTVNIMLIMATPTIYTERTDPVMGMHTIFTSIALTTQTLSWV